AKPLQHSRGYFESASINTDVFTEDEHPFVLFHLFPNSLANCFDVCGQRHELRCLVVDVFKAVLRLREWIFFCDLNGFINLLIDACLQFIDRSLGCDTAVREKTLEPSDRVTFLPIVEEFRRYIPGVIVCGMAGHPECLAFNQCGAMPGTCPFDGARRRIPY